MNKIPLYSIGHSTRTAEEFITLLKRYAIQYLADVRSRPYSGYNPQYNRESLQHSLYENEVQYVYMGDTLGGRPEDETCYTNGRIDYTQVQEQAFFKSGIERLKTAYHKNIAIAIMCSEANPANCHRSRLIGRALAKEGIVLNHIDEDGNIKTQPELGLDIEQKLF